MDVILRFIFLLIIIILFIILAIKGKMNWASSLSLFLSAISPLVLALIFIYALPTGPDTQIAGPVIPIIPFTVSFVMLIFIIFTIKRPKEMSKELPARQSNIRFIFLVLGVLIQLVALFFALIAFYASNLFGLSKPSPTLGIVGYFILNCFSAVFLYSCSIKNTIDRPNLMRWIVFFLIMFFRDSAIMISFILIYAFPVLPRTIYPFWAGINTISYLPYSILIVFIARSYIYSKS